MEPNLEIKQELGSLPGISQESASETIQHNALQRKVEVLKSEKKKLIGEMSSIRKQYNTACYDHHKKTKELFTMCAQKDAAELKIKNLSSANEKKERNLNDKLSTKEKLIAKLTEEKENIAAELSRTKSELLQSERKLKKEKEDNADRAKTISLVSGENRQLKARLRQYQSNNDLRQYCVARNGVPLDLKATVHKTASKEYEVQQFLSHKMKNRKRFFLVRWKGYSSEHDSWESEENIMNCPKILSEYLKVNNLQS